jgi:hypothetical protein
MFGVNVLFLEAPIPSQAEAYPDHREVTKKLTTVCQPVIVSS